MIDYYSVLARAIANLDSADPAARKELYGRARGPFRQIIMSREIPQKRKGAERFEFIDENCGGPWVRLRQG
jgi:hypothetical protein